MLCFIMRWMMRDYESTLCVPVNRHKIKPEMKLFWARLKVWFGAQCVAGFVWFYFLPYILLQRYWFSHRILFFSSFSQCFRNTFCMQYITTKSIMLKLMYTHIKLKVKFHNKVLVIMLQCLGVCTSVSFSFENKNHTHTYRPHPA